MILLCSSQDYGTEVPCPDHGMVGAALQETALEMDESSWRSSGDVPGERGPGTGPAEGLGPGGCSASLPRSLCRGVPREIPQHF